MSSHDKLPRFRQFAAVSLIGGLALTGCGEKVTGAQSDSTPVPSETTATAPVTPGAETTTATPTAETETTSPEIIGNIDVSKLSPAARDYATRLAPERTNNMTSSQFGEAIQITPDIVGSDDPSVLAELAFVRRASIESAAFTPEVLARAKDAGTLFSDFVIENYYMPALRADEGPDATPIMEDLDDFRDRATRYDVLSSLDPELAPKMTFTLEDISTLPDLPLQATVSYSVTESQVEPTKSMRDSFALSPSVANRSNRSATLTWTFSPATVDGVKIWDVDVANS